MTFFFAQSRIRDIKALLIFYDQYAPQLWGVILLEDLPIDQSKNILVNTILKAWHHPYRIVLKERNAFTWLVKLAYAECLSVDTLGNSLEVTD